MSSEQYTCADPESIVRGGPTLNVFCLFLVDEGRYDSNASKRGPSLARQRNGVSLPSQ